MHLKYFAISRLPSAVAVLKPLSTRHTTIMSSSSSFSDLVQTRAPRIILGSSSSSRRQLMDELATEHSFTYDVITADIDEKAIRYPDPQELVMKLAHAKADAIIEKLRSSSSSSSSQLTGLLLTCDQVVTHENRILEKPVDAQEAREFIAGYGRGPASTVGSTVCTDLATGLRSEGIDIATIHFSNIPEATAEVLIEEGDVMWCAGGLMIEHPLVQPYIVKMDGGEDSIMGLCKDRVVQLLTEALHR